MSEKTPGDITETGQESQSQILPKEDILKKLRLLSEELKDSRHYYLSILDENSQYLRVTYEELTEYIERACIPSNLSARDMYSHAQVPARTSYENHVFLNQILDNGQLRQTRIGSLIVTSTCDIGKKD